MINYAITTMNNFSVALETGISFDQKKTLETERNNIRFGPQMLICMNHPTLMIDFAINISIFNQTRIWAATGFCIQALRK